jgi:uncharacterized protein YecT (DUF1311 family)
VALTGSDLRYTRRRVGSLPADADLNTLYDTLVAEGKDQPVEWLILEVLETRLADLIRNPATFSVSGEYSQSTSSNIDALKAEINAQRAWMAGLGVEIEGVGFGILHAEGPAFHR